MQRFADFPIYYPITIKKGSIWQRTIPILVPKEDGSGFEDLDTAGYVALMQARITHDSPSTVLSIGTHNARIITGIQSDSWGSWSLHIRIPATDTAGTNGPPAGFVGVYDLELQPPGDPGGRFAIFYGPFCVEPEVSR